MKTVIVLNNDQMGNGSPELGQKILATFLRKSTAMRDVTAIVLYNRGVMLTAADSPVRIELQQLHDLGVDLIPCGTCIGYYNVEPVVGEMSDMDTILREIDQAEKVITL